MEGEVCANDLGKNKLRQQPLGANCAPTRAVPYKMISSISVVDFAGFDRYITYSTPPGPLPQGMHTSGGFLVFAPETGVQK